jgi:hypothetical protein
MRCTRFTFALFIVGISSLTGPAFAASTNLTTTEQIILNMSEQCQGLVIDGDAFDKDRPARQAGRSWRLSSLRAARDSKIDQALYSKALSIGYDEETALEAAGTFRYSDESKFCVTFRAKIKADLKKWIDSEAKRQGK